MKRTWIIALGLFLALWSGADIVPDLRRGASVETQDAVFLILGVGLAIGEWKKRSTPSDG